ncbi:type II toxin-antitoxin system RatA family toxin [Testudinibacter aquarius]|uniref:Ribosome-associated toxin RatA of RatAB toxin-antitoxin module n=1 Tax=Testudinibacter aquarius TaxID=1524974 RepID=A0A4R3Y0P6_9PAST|nr:type II toxin-antitoxin system RatA family toxin [Testudinibacter aquarius]KAE9528446.1 ubiquinone-binding protein [Testudinibacter aquarius]TCV84208.1 ribosome-associated toxin RatA of RatAB toxin-antitoxin module [Testudinibacter aquarius]TNG92568.1 type II toxin-antitoxin system RatA family toxin [Testudinibacter aquarius]
MPSVNQSALVGYSATQMYQLVNNYEQYPEFLPGCVASQTLVSNENELTAQLVISKAGISQQFTTRNTMQPNKQIQMQLVEGPFRFLQGYWQFDEIDEHSCQIRLKLDFEFSSALISAVFGKIFEQLTMKMIDAFKQRAKEVYDV